MHRGVGVKGKSLRRPGGHRGCSARPRGPAACRSRARGRRNSQRGGRGPAGGRRRGPRGGRRASRTRHSLTRRQEAGPRGHLRAATALARRTPAPHAPRICLPTRPRPGSGTPRPRPAGAPIGRAAVSGFAPRPIGTEGGAREANGRPPASRAPPPSPGCPLP